MFRRAFILISLMLWVCSVAGQEGMPGVEYGVERYRYFKLFEEEDVKEKLEDGAEKELSSSIIYRPAVYRSLFGQNAAVINYHRGVGYFQSQEWFEGIRLPKLNSSRARKLYLQASAIEELSATQYHADTTFTERTEVGINLATRNYLAGAVASTTQYLAENWVLNCDIALRTGRDCHIKGVFTNQATINIGVSGAPDSRSRIMLALLFTPSERGIRKASFAEAFTLTSDNYYNPAWGYQDSKVRNANTTTSLLPTVIAAYNRSIDNSRRLNIALSTTIGSSAYGGLDWLDGATPLPDNYRYLPSYFTDPTTSEAVSSVWQNGDSRYTQINFDELHRRNRLQEQSVYILNKRVTRVCDIQLSASIDRTLSSNFTIKYGLYAELDRQRNFKSVADLLSGGEFEDIDYFLIDDDSKSNMLLNDMNSRGKRVGVSDRYGYDYALTTSRIALFAEAQYTSEQLQVDSFLKVGNSNIRRKGYFRKELFADNSYGASKILSFADWAARIAVQYSPNPQHHIYGSAAVVFEPEDSQNLFLQTEYNNRTINSPTLRRLFAANLGYRLQIGKLLFNTTLFARHGSRQTEVAHLFYDVASEFADIVTTDLATLAIGIEAEAHYNITDHLTIAAGATIGRYRFTGSPTVTVYADKDNRTLAQDCINSVSALRTGTTPEFTALGSVRYYERGWGANLSAEYHALRYVSPSLIRRTESVLSHTTTSEQRESLIDQEQLPNAFSLNLTLSKSFYLKSRKEYANSAAPHFTERHPKSKITIFLAVNNLLGNNNIIFRGYESSRIRKQHKWDDFTATPFAAYYLYAYPRTYFLQVKFSF